MIFTTYITRLLLAIPTPRKPEVKELSLRNETDKAAVSKKAKVVKPVAPKRERLKVTTEKVLHKAHFIQNADLSDNWVASHPLAHSLHQ